MVLVNADDASESTLPCMSSHTQSVVRAPVPGLRSVMGCGSSGHVAKRLLSDTGIHSMMWNLVNSNLRALIHANHVELGIY